MESEELYLEVLAEFCSQMDIYIPQFADLFKDAKWADYAVIAHAVKSNSRTIGATAFADLSFKHECAGKTGDITYIQDNYTEYISLLKELVENVRKML
jgi:HPt (histidine-containing phosphotransfer) domain-containing protein